jgi:hypothetical protein
MGENVQDEDPLRPVVHPSDQSVVIAMDIEYGSSTDNVGMSEVPSHCCQGVPLRSLGHAVPVHQRYQRIAMLFRELQNRRLADYPHDQVTKRKLQSQGAKSPVTTWPS